MSDSFNNIWEIYTSSWKAESAEEKMALFQKSLAPGCVYTDPLGKTHGWDALCSYMLDFHKQIPGGHFVTNYFLAHHEMSITKWDMCDASGNVLSDGISYGEYNQDGQLIKMTGFYQTP